MNLSEMFERLRKYPGAQWRLELRDVPDEVRDIIRGAVDAALPCNCTVMTVDRVIVVTVWEHDQRTKS